MVGGRIERADTDVSSFVMNYSIPAGGRIIADMDESSPSSPTARVLNIAAYKFVALDDLPNRRIELLELCTRLELRGTILLSEEGINLFIAGMPDAVQELLAHLRRDAALVDLDVKESWTDERPFGRMLVKIKREIIAFGVEGIEPATYTSKRMLPAQLKAWLDAGKKVTLLDVRNDYEVEIGTFREAVAMDLDHFRNFPKHVAALDDALRDQPVVTFCTGGIRCEKAGPMLEQVGFRDVYQLDGGILAYFEQCGGEHFDGECFVFDERRAVDHELKASKQHATCSSP